MSIYAIGDLHLSFGEGVDKSMDVFGQVWADHADKLRRNWTGLIEDDDTVVIAGDISWGLTRSEAMADLEWIHGLPGRKVLIKGNHDPWWTGIKRLNALYDDMYFLQNAAYEVEGLMIAGSRGWICPGSEGFDEHDEKIYRRELLRLEESLRRAAGRETIGFLHFPPANDRGEESGFTQLFEKYGVKEVYYGHLHGSEMFGRGIQGLYRGVRYSLISLDYLDCRPRLIREG